MRTRACELVVEQWSDGVNAQAVKVSMTLTHDFAGRSPPTFAGSG